MNKLILSCNAILFLLFLSSCKKEEIPLYKKEFSQEEKAKLSDQMVTNLIRKYGQGSTSEVMVLKEALIHQPQDANLWRELGAPCVKRGLASKFYEYYDNAIKYDALNWQGWRGYLYLYFYRDYERAIEDFNQLDTLTPNFVDYPQSTSIHFMRGICYLKLGDYDTALSYWNKHLITELKSVTEEYIDPTFFLFEGITFYKMGDINQAIASFKRGLLSNSNNANLLFWYSKSLLRQNKKEQAHIQFNKAQLNFDLENHNVRPYVKEFFQLFQLDLDLLKKEIAKMN